MTKVFGCIIINRLSIMYRRCGTFVLMHMHAYIHSESSNLHGTILVIYYVLIVLWGCILGLASSCLRMLSSLCRI